MANDSTPLTPSSSTLSRLLDDANIEQLRKDVEFIDGILAKGAVNLLIRIPQPGGFNDARRDALRRLVMLTQELLKEHDEAKLG